MSASLVLTACYLLFRDPLLTLFGGMGYTILLFAGFLLLPGWRLGFAGYGARFAAANLLLCAVLHRWLRKKGAALFAAL